jgi:hypothetical protein
MDVTPLTWIVAITGILLMTLLGGLQLIAAMRPRARWTIDNVYGGSPDATDPRAYFAFNQGSAWADPFFWAPLQIAGSTGMMVYGDLDLHLGSRLGLPREHVHLLGDRVGDLACLRGLRRRLRLHPTPRLTGRCGDLMSRAGRRR